MLARLNIAADVYAFEKLDRAENQKFVIASHWRIRHASGMEEPAAVDEEIIPEYGHRMSTWPVFWGVVAIIFGVVGVLASGYGAMQSAAMAMMPMDEILEDQMAESAASNVPGMEGMEGMDGMMTSMVDMAPLSLAAGIAQMVVAIVLIVGGIMLCNRKRIAAPTLKTWAVLKIAVGLCASWIGYKSSAAVMESIGEIMETTSGPSGGPSSSGVPDMAELMNMGVIIGAVSGLIWMLLLPVFFLFWFNRPAVKEDMKHGQGW